MRFLIDQDVFAATARLLKTLGHDAVPVADIGLSKAADETLLMVAHEQKRILVTRDRDYGSLVFLKSLGAGVLYLRMLPNTQDAVHAELTSVLGLYSEEELGKVIPSKESVSGDLNLRTLPLLSNSRLCDGADGVGPPSLPRRLGSQHVCGFNAIHHYRVIS
jgi:predicted nuclease of predicted toxin-antitoxin system